MNDKWLAKTHEKRMIILFSVVQKDHKIKMKSGNYFSILSCQKYWTTQIIFELQITSLYKTSTYF